MFSYRLLHMDMPVLADQKRLAYIGSVLTQDANLEDLPGVIADRDG